MDKLKFYLAAAVAVALLTLYLSNCKRLKKENLELTNRVLLEQNKFDSCVNAKTYTVTHIDTVMVPNYIIKEKVQPVDSMAVWRAMSGKVVSAKDADTTTDRQYFRRYYRDTLTTADFALPYFTSVDGYLNVIEFGNYKLFDRTTETSHVIQVPTPVIQEYKRSHLYFYFGLNTMFEQGLSGFSGGFSYINKKGWGLGVGYLRIEKSNMAEAKVYLKIL
jgi:hypothetical protein